MKQTRQPTSQLGFSVVLNRIRTQLVDGTSLASKISRHDPDYAKLSFVADYEDSPRSGKVGFIPFSELGLSQPLEKGRTYSHVSAAKTGSADAGVSTLRMDPPRANLYGLSIFDSNGIGSIAAVRLHLEVVRRLSELFPRVNLEWNVADLDRKNIDALHALDLGQTLPITIHVSRVEERLKEMKRYFGFSLRH